MENALKKRLAILKSRARHLKDHYVQHRQYRREDYGPPCTLSEVGAGEERFAGTEAFYRVRTAGNAIADEADELADRYVRLAEQSRWPNYVDEEELPLLAGDLRVRPDQVLFFDIETTGLAPNTYVFLCGVMYLEDGRFVADQLFARDYDEEKGVLLHLRDLFQQYPQLVTYNGISFDMPFVETRMAAARVDCPVTPRHLDLYPPAKRAFDRVLRNNRLVTIEHHLRGEERSGDIPGRYIPDAYHEFVRTRDARKIRSILYHNRMDLIAMVHLLNYLA